MDNNNQPAFPSQYSCLEEGSFGGTPVTVERTCFGLSKLEYIATHINVSNDLDGFSGSTMGQLLGRPLPGASDKNPNDAIEWWFEAEAKLRVMKAKALLAELEKH